MSLATSKKQRQDGCLSLRYFSLRRCWQDSSSCSSLSRIISHPLLNNNLPCQPGSYRAGGSLAAIFRRWKPESECVRKDGTCRLPLPGCNPGYRDPAGNEVKQDGTCQKKEYRRKEARNMQGRIRKYRRDLFWQ